MRAEDRPPSRAMTIERSRALLCPQPDVDVLLLGEAEHLLEAFLASDTGLLVAAERRAEEMLADLVDPDVAGLHRHRGRVRAVKIVGPDRTGEAVFDRV